MEIKHGLHLSQRPALVMTMRLRQALKLLQLPQLELNLAIKQELQTNPMLEEVDDLEEEAKAEERPGEADGPLPADPPEPQPEPEPADPRESEDDVFDLLPGNDPDSPYIPAEDHSAERYERVAVTTMGLNEHLETQLRLLPLSEEEVEVGTYIIGLLDERGFLSSPRGDGEGRPEMVVLDVAATLDKPVELVERVLAVIQSLEPSGVGARDLRECLLIQMRARGQADTLAYRLVEEQFDNMVHRRFHDVARHFRITLEQVQEAVDLIATLSPKPGLDVSAEEPNYIIPDLVVDKVAGEYVVYLNDRHVPRLRIRSDYERLLREKRRGDETRAFVQGKLSSARWLIQTIEQRRRTMIKVMTCIVEKQHEFFERGISQLKPLTLQDVAREIGMHESTVSRVTSGKYVQTQRGVFELKFFFSSGLKQESGEDISAKTAKDIISRLVGEEDRKSPLSDQRIAELMKVRGVDIARRTVAKYREQLQIPPARFRKRV
ncbi:MAG TPA: RNA polymerase factor sigma-54 [Candidatus Saccharimonadales bacterium]|nr:RNA polymerase factor sigma-54 [Candidatus Saccharimonadales bacterium]